MRVPFSTLSRASLLDALPRAPFDVLVVGGGITGAAVARDAAMRGLRTALVERADFASGTSSRSSRLIHGGLRYLEHGQLHLVYESSRERGRLLRLAPHLVRPLRFLWPVYEHARISRRELWAGLLLYDALALFRNIGRHRMIGPSVVSALEPAVRQSGLEGGALYHDAATDDARLTLATARAAAEAGAVVLNHLPVRALELAGPVVRGARAVDAESGREIVIAARVVVNATGPWTDDIRHLAEPDAAPSLRGTKGVHVAVPRERLGNTGALTLLSPIDGRVMFVLPSGALTIIGTTDTDYEGDPDAVRADAADAAYLLRSANAFFPAAHLAPADVVSAWAGIRPLVADGSDAPGAVSREHAVRRTVPGLVTVTGGKLTTHRIMARDTVDVVERELGRPIRRAPTGRVPLPGGAIASVDAEVDAATAATGSAALAEHLVHAHGAAWREVWALAAADPALAAPVSPDLPYIAAELHWGVEHEMALTLGDLLIRRTHVAFETRDHGRAAAPAAARAVAPLLGWTRERVDAELSRYEGEAAALFG